MSGVVAKVWPPEPWEILVWCQLLVDRGAEQKRLGDDVSHTRVEVGK